MRWKTIAPFAADTVFIRPLRNFFLASSANFA